MESGESGLSVLFCAGLVSKVVIDIVESYNSFR